MLESMLGPDMMRKMWGGLIGLVVSILAFVGMSVILISSINPIFHPHFWAAIALAVSGGLALPIKNTILKTILCVIALAAGLWVLLNVLGGFIEPPVKDLPDFIGGRATLPEFSSPVMLMLAGLGGIYGTFAGLIGIFGALKYRQ